MIKNYEKEIKLMALDNILYENTNKIFRDALVKLSNNYELSSDIRIRIQDAIKEGDVFFRNGHKSLEGLTDATGTPININV